MRSKGEEDKDSSSKKEIEVSGSKKDSSVKARSVRQQNNKGKQRKCEKRRKIHYFDRATKMRSMNSSDRIEEMIRELEGYRWDAVLLNETWRSGILQCRRR